MTSNDPELPQDHLHRINRVFVYIDQNLEGDLSLNTLADIAFFSPFHFHRVFKYITQETLKEYVTRKRIEKSASDLLHTSMPVLEIALRYGFGEPSSYSRAFKKYYGCSPTQFKKQNPHRHSKICQLKSKNGQAYPSLEKYLCVINNLQNWITMNATIGIEEMPQRNLAYVSCTGPQNLENAYTQLVGWATPKGLMDEQPTLITIYHDSFKLTEAPKVRLSACLELHQTQKAEGAVGLTSLEAGKCVVGRFTIGLGEFEKAWTGLFLWMNQNGYTKANREPFEIYHNNFKEHPEKKAIVDLCIPIG